MIHQVMEKFQSLKTPHGISVKLKTGINRIQNNRDLTEVTEHLVQHNIKIIL